MALLSCYMRWFFHVDAVEMGQVLAEGPVKRTVNETHLPITQQ